MVRLNLLLPSALVAFSMVGVPMTVRAEEAPIPAAHHEHMHGAGSEQMVEDHIARLHRSLKITPQQEEQWKPVADVIRDNDKTMRALVTEKRGRVETQTAVEDLAAYSEIAQAHAVAMKKLSDIFSVFYAGLTDQQRKLADDFFREHKHRHGHAHP